MISIAAMTTMLISHLESSGAVIGDGVAPASAGWSGGTPNIASFVPYTVLGFNGAQPHNPEIFSADPDWSTTWALRHYGGSRQQADWLADRVRSTLVASLRSVFGVDQFKVTGVVWNSLGALSRNDTVDPPYWQSQDVVTLLTSRAGI